MDSWPFRQDVSSERDICCFLFVSVSGESPKRFCRLPRCLTDSSDNPMKVNLRTSICQSRAVILLASKPKERATSLVAAVIVSVSHLPRIEANGDAITHTDLKAGPSSAFFQPCPSSHPTPASFCDALRRIPHDCRTHLSCPGPHGRAANPPTSARSPSRSAP